MYNRVGADSYPKEDPMDVRKKSETSTLLSFLLLGLTGCTDRRPAMPPTTETKPAATDIGGPGHSHERGKMLLADVGRKYHALLTAHLSPKGNELDIFFETADDQNPIPAAIPVESFTAQVKVIGEEQSKELKFEPVPTEELPQGEKPGTCSHFVAKAPWMRPDNTLNVVVFLTLEGERYRVTWEQFNPKKYAHHEE
jgi:hypothetical protein